MITGQGLRMFVLRLLVLGFLAFFSYSMGTQRGSLNAFGTIVAYSSVVFVPMFYMLPTIEAWIRKSTNLPAIAAVNFFLGWSLLGWVAALVWAFKKPSPVLMVRAMGELTTALLCKVLRNSFSPMENWLAFDFCDK